MTVDGSLLAALVRRRKESGVPLSVVGLCLGVTEETVVRIEAGDLPMTDRMEDGYREAILYGLPKFRYNEEQISKIEDTIQPFGKPFPTLKLFLAVNFAFHQSIKDMTDLISDGMAEDAKIMVVIDAFEEAISPRIGSVGDMGEGIFEHDEVGLVVEEILPLLGRLKLLIHREIDNETRQLGDLEEDYGDHQKPGPATKVRERRFTNRTIDIWRSICGLNGTTVGLDKPHRAFFEAVTRPVFTFEPYRKAFGVSWMDNKFKSAVARWNKDHAGG